MNLEELRKKYGHTKNNRKITDSSDLSMVFLKDESLYFFLPEIGLKFKISLSRLGIVENKIDSLDVLFETIDTLQLPENTKVQNFDAYRFCKDHVDLLSGAELCLLLYNNLDGYLNCLKLAKDDFINHLCICDEAQIVSIGAVVLDSCASGEISVSYRYRNKVVEMEIGEDVIEVKEILPVERYSSPKVKDLIKGLIFTMGVKMGWINQYVFLQCASFSLSFVIKEMGRVRNFITSISSIVTIPVRMDLNVRIEQNQKLSIEMEGQTIASDISDKFDIIDRIEVDVNYNYNIIGSKGSRKVSEPLFKLIDQDA